MTKIEEKLIELGYEKDIGVSFRKTIIINQMEFVILLYLKNRKIKDYKLFVYNKECGGVLPIIKKQQDIFDLQQAFNTMQKDLEIIKECEEE